MLVRMDGDVYMMDNANVMFRQKWRDAERERMAEWIMTAMNVLCNVNE
jgi:hypothetical protein